MARAPSRVATTTPANDQYSTPAIGYGLNAALQGKAGAISWESGLDVRFARGTEFERFRVVNGAFTRGREAGGETLVGGVYLEAAYDQAPLILTGGVRTDQHDDKRDPVRSDVRAEGSER